MKKMLLLAICALLSPLHILSAAQETQAAKEPTHKTTTKKAGTKKHGKKGTKTGTTHHKATRTKTTAAGKSAESTTKAKKHTTKAEKSKKPRTKTTTAGAKKSHGTTKSTPAKGKTTAGSRSAKTSYKKEHATHKATAAKKDAHKPKATRAYHKGGVKYRQFNRLNEMHAENFGVISKPTTKTVALNKPGRGYVNANLINLTTADGKQGKLLFDTHNRTAAQAQKKGLGHKASKTVEVYAGTDSNDLALIGEYPLAKGSENIQLDVDPSGQVILSDNGAPLTKFSIHQHQK